ncbi:Trans-aconitate 2-methyltransferase [Streptomyces alboniger]
MPDREERFRIMLDMVEALVGTAPRVLDLACGTGSITARLFARFPGATSTGVDLDPALLAIAEGTFADDDRVTFVTADLKNPDWPSRLPYDSYDAVLTATALHWLHSEPLAALYGQVAELVRDGGVFMNADHVIDESTPRINAAERAQRHARMEQARESGVLGWTEWWQLAAKDPVLAEPAAPTPGRSPSSSRPRWPTWPTHPTAGICWMRPYGSSTGGRSGWTGSPRTGRWPTASTTTRYGDAGTSRRPGSAPPPRCCRFRRRWRGVWWRWT